MTRRVPLAEAEAPLFLHLLALGVPLLLGRTALPLPYTGMRARRSAGRLWLRTFGAALPGYLTGHFTFGPDALPRVRAAASRGGRGVIVVGA